MEGGTARSRSPPGTHFPTGWPPQAIALQELPCDDVVTPSPLSPQLWLPSPSSLPPSSSTRQPCPLVDPTAMPTMGHAPLRRVADSKAGWSAGCRERFCEYVSGGGVSCRGQSGAYHCTLCLRRWLGRFLRGIASVRMNISLRLMRPAFECCRSVGIGDARARARAREVSAARRGGPLGAVASARRVGPRSSSLATALVATRTTRRSASGARRATPPPHAHRRSCGARRPGALPSRRQCISVVAQTGGADGAAKSGGAESAEGRQPLGLYAGGMAGGEGGAQMNSSRKTFRQVAQKGAAGGRRRRHVAR